MVHLVFRSAVFLMMGMCAVFAFLRIWPYDDHDLHLLMFPDNCAAPCFMGIQPGLTTPDQAVTMLQNHNWVASNSVRRTNGDEVMWSWSGRQPAVIDSTIAPQLIVWASDREQQVVNGIQVPIRLPIGLAILALGEPPWLGIRSSDRTPEQALVTALYDHFALEIWSHVSCPVSRRKFLESPLNLFWVSLSDTVAAVRPADNNLNC